MVKGKHHRRNETAILTLASNVRKYRKARNFTIVELANVLDADYAQVGRIERGEANSTISIIFDIAAALKVEPSQLLELPQAEF